MAAKTKQCYLVTSPEKSQPEVGNGSSSTDSRTRIGSLLLAGPKETNASSSQLETPSSSVSDDMSQLEKEAKALYDRVSVGIGAIPWEVLEDRCDGIKAHWIKNAMANRRTKKLRESGSSGETDMDLLTFWNQRRIVPQK